MLETFYHEIETLKKNGLYRLPKVVSGSVDATVDIDGKEMILLSSNNYLGLANHTEVKTAAMDALNKYGAGAGASRLISGNLEIHEKLEAKTAAFKGTPNAMLFSTGYMANIGVITTLAGKGDLILSDELNHASIIDGCRLSQADTWIYPHLNINCLNGLLLKSFNMPGSKGYNNRFIVTDGIFSMDGDIAPLPELLELAKKYNAFLMVDDAHGTGVLGKTGKGTCEHFELKDERIIHIGTFSKALGSLGGYVAGSKIIIEYLKNRARSFIYSTALPPSVCAASVAAIDIIEKDPSIRNRLWENVFKFKTGLKHAGFKGVESQSHIIPVVIGDVDLTMAFSKGLFKNNVFAPGIRPPTVPEKQSRIRVSLMASHTDQHIDRVLSIFKDQRKQLGIIKG
jgi:8-amino-7-oxononanoate synthase